MAKTNRDVIDEALRMIGVSPLSQGSDGEDYAEGLIQLSAILEEADEVQQIGLTLTSDALPDWSHIPLAQMVAGRICTHFEVPQYAYLYARGLTKLRAKAANEARVPGQPVQATYF